MQAAGSSKEQAAAAAAQIDDGASMASGSATLLEPLNTMPIDSRFPPPLQSRYFAAKRH